MKNNENIENEENNNDNNQNENIVEKENNNDNNQNENIVEKEINNDNNQNENIVEKEINNDNNQNENIKENKKKYEGVHFNKKLLYLILILVIIFILYKILIPSSMPVKQVTQKKEVETVQRDETKENDLQTTYDKLNKNTIIQNKKILSNTNKSNTNKSNTNNENINNENINKYSDLYDSTNQNNFNNSNSNQLTEEEQFFKQRKLEQQRKYYSDLEIARTSQIQIPQSINPRTSQISPVQNNNYQNLNENMQGSKKNFLDNEKSNNIYNNANIIPAISPFELMAGDFIPCVVITAMNSDLPTKTVIAQVSQNIYDSVSGNYLLIPQGTKLIGLYDSNVTWGQNRLLLIWQRLIFPDGASISLNNMAGVDLSGQAGLQGEVNNHFASLLKGVILSSIIGGAAGIVDNNDDNSWQNDAGKGGGQVVVEVGNKFAEKALNRQPTLIIHQGDRFNVIVNSDIILRPYKN